MIGNDVPPWWVLFGKEKYELKTEAHKGWQARSDYFFDSGWNFIFGVTENGNARAKSSSTTCSCLCGKRLESPPYGLFQAFFGCAVFKASVGAAIPATVAEAERETAAKRSVAK